MKKETPELYEHQKRAIEFIENKNYYALFMEMGTGKTKVAIEKTARHYEKKEVDSLIVISPNSVKEQWAEEQFPLHFPYTNFSTHIWDGATTKKEKYNFEKSLNDYKNFFLFSSNVEAFQSSSIDPFIKNILEKRKCKVVIDESVKIKNGRRKPKRGKRGGAIRTNKILDLFENVKYKAILTGTPTPNSPFDLWSQFEFLKKDFFSMDYFYFTHQYGIMTQNTTVSGQRYTSVIDEKTYKLVKYALLKHYELTPRIIADTAYRFGMSTKDVILINRMKEFTQYKNLDDLKAKISRITFSVKKTDCLDLPDKVYEKLYCTLSGEQKRLYTELKKEMFTEYGGKELTVTTKVVIYMRLQMITGGLFPFLESQIKIDRDGNEYIDESFKYELISDNCKIKVLLDDLETISKDTYIIIWARFRAEIDLIYDTLTKEKYTCEKYYGDSSIDVINRFKKGEFQILIGTLQKGGEGLNLQISTLQYYYSNNFRGDLRDQGESRSHRVGQTNKVTYKDLICRGTVDERIYEVLLSKGNLIDYFRTINNIFE